MRIGIDARMYSQSGIGRYTQNLITHLQKLDHENQYFILLKKEEFDSLNFENNFQKVLADIPWYGLSEQLKIPKLLNSLDLDLVHFPHFNVPIFYQNKFIVTIHDLIHQNFQMRRSTTHDPLFYKLKQIGYTSVFNNTIKKSKKILTPSNYVKQLLVKKWKVENEKIVATYEGVDDKIIDILKNLSDIKSKQILEKFNIKSPYIFYVGNAHPHKNVEGLIKAFLEIRKNSQNLQLVLAGSDHYFWSRIKKEFQQKDIIFTGKITDEELVVLYKNAEVFVLPSFEEGFGIPLLESFATGCPVVSSNAGSLPEVGGNGALYFDPKNIDDMVNKISTVITSEKLRKELVEKGKQRIKDFSWKILAEQTLEVFQKCG